MNMQLKQKLVDHFLTIKNRKLKASITVESAFSFTLTVFILVLMLGPLFVIKTSSDIMIEMNNVSKLRCNYEMLKNSVEDTSAYEKFKEYVESVDFLEKNFRNIENVLNYAGMVLNFSNKYSTSSSEYQNLSSVYSLNNEVYDEKTGIVNYDFNFSFKLPYNVLNINEVEKRLVSYRRAFIGADGDRFDGLNDNGDYVYVANNHVNSNVYHSDINCSYLIKNTYSFTYDTLSTKRNELNQKYTKCSYCFKKIKIKSDTICYATSYGERFHYKSNCPNMTAYVSKILREDIEKYNLTLCSRCKRKEEG